MSGGAKDGHKLTEAERRGYGRKIRAYIRAAQVTAVCRRHLRSAKPVAIFTGGQPGSGKSSVIVSGLRSNSRFADANGIAVIDPDGLRLLFPESEFEMAGGGGSFSQAALVGSGNLAYEICVALARKRRHFVHEGTLASLRYLGPEMDALRKSGYAIEVHAAAVYPDLSFARTVFRSEMDASESATGFGRAVPKAIHDVMAASLPDCVDELWKAERVDRIAIYDRHKQILFDGSLEGAVGWQPTHGSVAMAGNPGQVIRSLHAQPNAADLVEALRVWLDAAELAFSDERHPAAPVAAPSLVAQQLAEAEARVVADVAANALHLKDIELQLRLLNHR